jgi:hypothetical protein
LVGRAYAALVPRVDADGNDIDGLRNTNVSISRPEADVVTVLAMNDGRTTVPSPAPPSQGWRNRFTRVSA